MSGIGKFKLTDAIKTPSDQIGAKKAGKSKTGPGSTAADKARDIAEAKRAKNAEGSIRDRMVDIGRAGKQAGRQGGS